MRRQWVWARWSLLNPAAKEMGLDLPSNWSIQEALGGGKAAIKVAPLPTTNWGLVTRATPLATGFKLPRNRAHPPG